jgi:type VI secretion system protein ImpJ
MLPEKTVWTQGMLVKPVHMQQQDRYADSQLRRRITMLHPHAWGFTEFAVDPGYLGMGKIVLSKAEGMLPDGTLFEIDQARGNLALDVPAGVTDKFVVLALPLNADGSLETRDEETSGLSTRYVRSPARIRDGNAYRDRAGNEADILCGRLDLRLMFEEEAGLTGFVAMRAARILESPQDGGVTLDSDFQPTFLHLNACPALQGRLREILALLSHRADYLATRINSAGRTGSAELADFMLLQCLNRMEPLFRHLDATPRLHPEAFYRLLLCLVGELSTFAERGKRPRELEAYSHARQWESFAKLMDMARHVLSMVLEQHAVLIPLQPRKNNIQVASIPDKNLFRSSIFVLTAKADMDQESLRALLPKQIKIGTPENIRELVNTHLPGVKLVPMPVAPRQIPFHAGKTYFQLDFSANQLAQFAISTGCALHVSGAFPNLALQLWAVKE